MVRCLVRRPALINKSSAALTNAIKAREEFDHLQEECKGLKERDALLEARVQELHARERKLREENDALCTFRQREEDDTLHLRQQLEDAQGKLVEAQQQAAETEAANDAALKERESLIDELRRREEALLRDLDGARSEADAGRASADEAARDREQVVERLAQTQEQLTRLERNRNTPVEKVEAALRTIDYPRAE